MMLKMDIKQNICLLLLLVLFNNSAYSLTQSKQSYQTLKETIQALDVTKNKSKSKLLSLDQYRDKSLYNEYSVFIEYLSFRIKENCLKIEEYYGIKHLSELPCNLIKNKKQQLDNNKYKTEDEKIQSLDDELMTALGEFDDMLLKEEEAIAQSSRQNSTGEGTSKASYNSGLDGKGALNQNQNRNETTGSIIDKSKNSKSKAKQTKKYKKNKLDKINDDIVARQLKEAAESEKDPVLKEKLWQEYYKYKQKMIK